MLKTKLLYSLICLLSFGIFRLGLAQNPVENPDTVYTFPFSMESKLLVFKGEMNGVQTDFAFDTGAAMGLANTKSEPAGRLKVKGKQIKMRDSNRELQKVKTGVSDEIRIAEFSFPKVRSLVNDMTYLYCMDFYLLGSDIIRQLNWEIDFEKSLIHVSKTPFSVSESMVRLPVTYRNNRPFVTATFAGQEFQNVLIDFGYTDMMDFPDQETLIQPFLAAKDSLGQSNPNISTSMGALGIKTYETRSILVDSLKIGDHYFSGIPVDFEETPTSKLGLGFFANISKRTIINNSESTYHLDLKPEPPTFKDPIHIGLKYQDGQIIVIGKPLGLVPEDRQIEIGEEIAAVNGKKPEDFGDECEFLLWSFTSKTEQMELTKKDGTMLVFEEIPLK